MVTWVGESSGLIYGQYLINKMKKSFLKSFQQAQTFNISVLRVQTLLLGQRVSLAIKTWISRKYLKEKKLFKVVNHELIIVDIKYKYWKRRLKKGKWKNYNESSWVTIGKQGKWPIKYHRQNKCWYRNCKKEVW